ncbi:MAG: hypothetical protein RJQ08_13515 [Salinisphaeraceae bacterium]
MSTWRDIARPIVAETINRVGRDNPRELRKALRDAYPFGERKYWPYRAWLAEVRAQIGHDRTSTEQKDLFDQTTETD